VRTLHWPPPQDLSLRGSLVRVEWARARHADALFGALDHDAAWTHVRGRPVSPDEWTTILEAAPNLGRWPLVVTLTSPTGGASAGTVVGTTSFLDVSTVDSRLEIGHTAYSPDVWGTGVNVETKELLLGWAFEVGGFQRVQLKTDIRNVRSQRAIAGLGAQREGVLRSYQLRPDGTLRDTVMFSILAEEWPAVRIRLRERIAR
jgi:N-acetyltransferase